MQADGGNSGTNQYEYTCFTGTERAAMVAWRKNNIPEKMNESTNRLSMKIINKQIIKFLERRNLLFNGLR